MKVPCHHHVSPLEWKKPWHSPSGLLSILGDTHATWNEKSAENCCPDLLNDECGHFRRGNNYGVECTRTQHQRLLLDSGRGSSKPYSGRAFRVADRTASASTLQSVVLRHLCGSKLLRHPTVKSFAQPKGKRAVSAVYGLHPVSERRLRRRGILQGHHFGHGAGLELDELINHC